MDHSRDTADVLNIAGLAYPFTPIPVERTNELVHAWRTGEDAERTASILATLGEAAGADAAAMVGRRIEASGGVVDEDLIYAAGFALGLSRRAAGA